MTHSITATEFRNLLLSDKTLKLIDVRTPVEYREIHIDIARNEPLDRLDPRAIQLSRNGNANEPLYVICRSGARGKQACEKLLAAGIENVINIEGGTVACASVGVPVVRGKKAVPLNCQVQMLTGMLIVVSSALAIAVHLNWAVIAAFMGAGLFYSGITNTCAMGAILARMPWNQVATAD